MAEVNKASKARVALEPAERMSAVPCPDVLEEAPPGCIGYCPMPLDSRVAAFVGFWGQKNSLGP